MGKEAPTEAAKRGGTVELVEVGEEQPSESRQQKDKRDKQVERNQLPTETVDVNEIRHVRGKL